MTALVGLECNGCGVRMFTRSYVQVSTTSIREAAKRDGWHKKYHDGVAVDICFTCWEAGLR